MKKFLLLPLIILLLGISTSFSQSLELYWNDLKLNNDQVMIVNVKNINAEHKICGDSLKLYNKSSNNLNVKVKRLDLSMVPDSYNYICWQGNCETKAISTSKETIASESYRNENTNNVPIMCFVPNNKIGISQVKYTFFVDKNPNDSVSVVIKYVTTSSANKIANNVFISPPYPNPANEITTFSFNNFRINVPIYLNISNIFNQRIKRYKINNESKSGKFSINVKDIPEGMYFYSIETDGITTKTNKLIIRR